MRVLWFSVTPSLYGPNNVGHNGGGWIESLERLVRQVPDLELGIAFLHPADSSKVKDGAVTYYPMSVYDTPWKQRVHRYMYWREDAGELAASLSVIEDFKPDVIHVFGSEWSFGLVAQHTDTPVVVHIQGLARPYLNAYFPPGYHWIDLPRCHALQPKRIFQSLLGYGNFRHRAMREVRILRGIRHVMGRTEWDRGISSLLAPAARYHYCSEVLRPTFYESRATWVRRDSERLQIISSLSAPHYKGMDLLLKTARLLRDRGLDFDWKVLGMREMRMAEWKTGIRAEDVGVQCMGTQSADGVKDQLLRGDLFVHTSYIDNSPNSICEAQLLGMPVISTNVGGISSLVSHRESGMLVPANDPHLLAAFILELAEDGALATALGHRAAKVAEARHDRARILQDLLKVYREAGRDRN